MEPRSGIERKQKAIASVNSAFIDRDEVRSLLSCLSHELRRPLVSLRAGFDLLLADGGAISAEQQTHLKTMVGLCDDLLELTQGYLDYSALVDGQRVPCYGSFSMSAIIREIDRQFGSLAVAKGLSWEATLAGPDAQVETDASRCQQIFGNLVMNAIKYTPRGGLVRVVGDFDDEHWNIMVIDNGPGIPEESLQRVFEPFYRLPRDEHSAIEGNGLGLSICRELVVQLRGTITIETAEGGGTSVQVRFPRSCIPTHQPHGG